MNAIRPYRSTRAIMLQVLIALVPGILVYAALIDTRVLTQMALAIAMAVSCESLLLLVRGKPVMPYILDGSVAVAAVLLVLCLPQSLPLWQLAIGIGVMCTLGKHLFGGLGHNPFNPAMVGYAFLLVSFPLQMTQWPVNHGWLDEKPTQMSVIDSLSRATPLDQIDQLRRAYRAAPDRVEHSDTLPTSATSQAPTAEPQATEAATLSHRFSNAVLQSEWLWVSLAWLAGGLWLLWRHIISWHIPLAVLSTLGLLYVLAPVIGTGPFQHAPLALLSGGIMLGAFFIATDPVSSAASPLGKLIYGVGIGVLCFFIREFSRYPEGFAFAVLLMNTCVPLIDHTIKRSAFRPGARPT